MVKINVFGRDGCELCDATKRKLNHFLTKWDMHKKVEMIFHDMDTVDGRAEGAFHDVEDIPTTIVERGGEAVARWNKAVPNSDRIRAAIEDLTNAAH